MYCVDGVLLVCSVDFSPRRIMQRVVQQEAQVNPKLRSSAVTFAKIFAKETPTVRTKHHSRRTSSERDSRSRSRKKKRIKKKEARGAYAPSAGGARWNFARRVKPKKVTWKKRSGSRKRKRSNSRGYSTSRSPSQSQRNGRRRPLPPITPPTSEALMQLMADTRCDAKHTERHTDAVLPHLRSLEPRARKHLLSYDGEGDSLRIATPEFCFPHLFDGPVEFRKKHSDFVVAISLDACSGGPFMRFLRKMGVQRNVYSLMFWQEAQEYLSTSSTDLLERQQVRLLRARALSYNFLQPESTLFTPSVRQTLREMLLRCLGDDLVRAAQDHVSKRLMSPWKIFMNQDRKRFAVSSLSERRRVTRTEFVAHNLLATSSEYMRAHGTDITRHLFARHRGSQDDLTLPPDTERRKWLAVKLLLDTLVDKQTGIPVAQISETEMVRDEDNMGSLALRPVKVNERPDIVEERARLQYNRERRELHGQRLLTAERRAQALRLQEKEATRLEVPQFFKPMRRGNQTHTRLKPM